jgi:hypothetical protein
MRKSKPKPAKTEPYYLVIGYIDSYGAIHHKKIRLGADSTHESYWPTVKSKRWRFVISDWELSKSVIGEVAITEEEAQDILSLMRKILQPPEWYLWGEVWDKAGRPRGEALDKLHDKWERSRKRLTRK